jgi:hypothetical protein
MERIRGQFEFIKTKQNFLNTTNQLRAKESMQWRLPACTSSDGKWSVIIIVPHQSHEYVLHVPYYYDRPSKPKQLMEENRSVYELVIDGLKKETGIVPDEMIILGSYTVKDSSGVNEDHIKYVVRVLTYQETDLQMINGGRTGKPVWMSNLLLRKHIYASTFRFLGSVLPHPQRKTYEKYIDLKECSV